MIMLDTHVAVAFYDGRSAGLSAKTKRLVDGGKVLISPAVLLEMEVLHEIGRLREGAAAVAALLHDQLDIHTAGESFADVARAALPLAFTRDPFDRLIVAHAAVLKAPLVTHDTLLQHHYPAAIG